MTAGPPFYRAWRDALTTERDEDDPAEVVPLLVDVAERARNAWPDLAVDHVALSGHLGAVCPAQMSTSAFLAAVNAEDVALAYACASGDRAALDAFTRRFDRDLRMVFAQRRGNKPPFDEYAQVVRTRLLTGERPRIAEFAGIGELKNWLRVAASRVLVDLQRGLPGAGHLDEEAALAVPTPDDDPETEYLKRLYRAEMKSAFERAVEDLTAVERNCLRDYYARGLTIDQLAAARGIHRATAARRVAHARSAVLRHTRQQLMQRTQMSQDELASVVRLIESQLYVSVERVFAHEA